MLHIDGSHPDLLDTFNDPEEDDLEYQMIAAAQRASLGESRNEQSHRRPNRNGSARLDPMVQPDEFQRQIERFRRRAREREVNEAAERAIRARPSRHEGPSSPQLQQLNAMYGFEGISPHEMLLRIAQNPHREHRPHRRRHHHRHHHREVDVDNMSYEDIIRLTDEIGHVRVTLTPDEIAVFPVIPVKDTDHLSCGICLEEIKDERRSLPCSDYYHPQCIDKWLTEEKSTCPCCRMDLREAL
eukprot:TRINITY_DN4571_c2_g1_i2.p1 TRINITY_DN4571_c2_g1~~TRINITY_DN4571_c2_g1_i2.p1  ORF type:complete len:242 (+),score=29.54 TRINITY_DN4571_c2_g1_i2:42-767(+)